LLVGDTFSHFSVLNFAVMFVDVVLYLEWK